MIPTLDLAPLTTALDLAGTFAFALSGAAAGVKHRLDLFGVLVLSFAAATSGGIFRDVVIGAIPPAALRQLPYMAIPLAAGVVTFYWHPLVERLRHPVLLFDAAGLAFFAVSGTQKALAFHLDPLPAAMLGMVTGIGGGMARDLLVAEVPSVLRAEIYAVAALAGAGVVVLGGLAGLPSAVVTPVGIALCFLLRVAALRYGWRLPVAGGHPPASDDGSGQGPGSRGRA